MTRSLRERLLLTSSSEKSCRFGAFLDVGSPSVSTTNVEVCLTVTGHFILAFWGFFCLGVGVFFCPVVVCFAEKHLQCILRVCCFFCCFFFFFLNPFQEVHSPSKRIQMFAV